MAFDISVYINKQKHILHLKGSEKVQLLSIGVTDKYEVIKKKLQEQYNQIESQNVSVDVEQSNCGDTKYITCNINDDVANMGFLSENVRLTTINVLADYIICQYESKIVSRIISTNYCYFAPNERKEILNIAIKSLKENDCKNVLNSLYFIRRKNIIIRQLIEYFDSNKEINIDGFVNFRLKDYVKDLEIIVEKAVDDYLMECEYKEFIRLLKYFIEIQEPKLEIVHVIVVDDGKFMLTDGNNIEITNQCIRDFMTEVNEGEINYDDLLVSSLITLAPEKVIIHGAINMQNKELLDTIKNVFAERVKICKKCDVCIKDNILEQKAPL